MSKPTTAEHNVAVWLVNNNGMMIGWAQMDAYQRDAWIEKAREVIRVVHTSEIADGESGDGAPMHHLHGETAR